MEYVLLILFSALFGAILIPGYEFLIRLAERAKSSKLKKTLLKLAFGVFFWAFYFLMFFVIPQTVQDIMGLKEIIMSSGWVYLISITISGILVYKYLLKPWLNRKYPPIRRGLKAGEKMYQGTVFARSYDDFCGFGLTFRISEVDAYCPILAVPQGVSAGSFDEYPSAGKNVILYAKETNLDRVKAVTGVFSEHSQLEA